MKSKWKNFCIAFVYTIIICMAFVQSEKNKPKQTMELEKREYIKAIVTPTPTPAPNKVTRYYQSVIKGCYLDEVSLTKTELELTSLGKYFVTAYCPAECGYNGYNYPRGWTTASDTICHRASYENRYIEPTTCAISRSIHRFGDTFYIEEFDRVFVAEDTGSAVKGKHLDLFYEEYSDVCSFPTGYYTVYSVEVNTYQVKACKYDVREILQKQFLRGGM